MRRAYRTAGTVLRVGLVVAVLGLLGLPVVAAVGLPVWVAPAVGAIAVEVMS